MQPSPSADNVRESYRCPVAAPQKAARLCAGSIWSSVQVLDESRGGFGVLTPGLSGVAVGDLVQLRTAYDCCEAEVMHVTECPPTGDQDQPALRLGLKRVRELFFESDKPLPWYKVMRVPWRRTPYGTGWTLGTVGLVFLLLVGFLPFLAVIDWGCNLGEMKLDFRSAEERTKAAQPWISRFTASDERPPATSASPTVTVRSHDNDCPPAAPSDNRHRRDWLKLLDHSRRQPELGRWNDSVLATIAWVVERIGLTESQKTRIAELLRQTNDALARLSAHDANAASDQSATQRSSMLKTAFDQLMQILTDAQRVQWADLLRESGKPAQAKMKESP